MPFLGICPHPQIKNVQLLSTTDGHKEMKNRHSNQQLPQVSASSTRHMANSGEHRLAMHDGQEGVRNKRIERSPEQVCSVFFLWIKRDINYYLPACK